MRTMKNKYIFQSKYVFGFCLIALLLICTLITGGRSLCSTQSLLFSNESSGNKNYGSTDQTKTKPMANIERKVFHPSVIDTVHHYLWNYNLVEKPSAAYIEYLIRRDVQTDSEWECVGSEKVSGTRRVQKAASPEK